MLDEIMDQNCWANETLLEFCKKLTPEQLATDATGTFGRLGDTLRHTVLADAGYLYRLGIAVTDANPYESEQSIEDLIEIVERCREGWKKFFASEVEAAPLEREFGGSRWEIQPAVVVTQAIHHGAHHRAEACVNLTLMGLQPPGLQAWEWAADTGRMKNMGPSS